MTAAALLLIILHIQAGAADQSGSMRFDYAVRKKRGGSGGSKYCTSELRMELGIGTLRKNLKGPESRDTG